MSIPEILKRYALTNPLTISERRQILTFDNADQTLALGASVDVEIMTDLADASIPPIGVPGQNLILTAGQVLLIERFLVTFIARDISAKLKLVSAAVYDPSGNPMFGMKTQGAPLPYTFAPVVGDTVMLSLDPSDDNGMLVDPTFVALNGTILNINFAGTLTNTDGAAAHTYRRQLLMHYRIVSGINPGIPRVIPITY